MSDYLTTLRKQVEQLKELEARLSILPWRLYGESISDGKGNQVGKHGVFRQDCQACADLECMPNMRNSLPSLLSALDALIHVATMAQRFGSYAHVLQVLALEDKRDFGSTNGWNDLDPVLGARGQILTLGDFRLLAEALSKLEALGKEQE